MKKNAVGMILEVLIMSQTFSLDLNLLLKALDGTISLEGESEMKYLEHLD